MQDFFQQQYDDVFFEMPLAQLAGHSPPTKVNKCQRCDWYTHSWGANGCPCSVKKKSSSKSKVRSDSKVDLLVFSRKKNILGKRFKNYVEKHFTGMKRNRWINGKNYQPELLRHIAINCNVRLVHPQTKIKFMASASRSWYYKSWRTPGKNQTYIQDMPFPSK